MRIILFLFLFLKDCGSLCPLANFVNYTMDKIVKNSSTACKLDELPSLTTTPTFINLTTTNNIITNYSSSALANDLSK